MHWKHRFLNHWTTRVLHFCCFWVTQSAVVLFIFFNYYFFYSSANGLGLPWWLSGKESACNTGTTGDSGSTPGSPGGGHGNPLWYSCLENPMERMSLAGYSPWGHTESDMTEVTQQTRKQMDEDTDVTNTIPLLNIMMAWGGKTTKILDCHILLSLTLDE